MLIIIIGNITMDDLFDLRIFLLDNCHGLFFLIIYLKYSWVSDTKYDTSGNSNISFHIAAGILTLRKLEGHPLWIFQKCMFQREGETMVFVTFNIIINHIFLENFIKIHNIVQKIWRISVNISYFYQFSSIFWIFWHFLVTKKLILPAYNRLCQHFLQFYHTLNTLFKNCRKLYWYQISFSWNMKRGSDWPFPWKNYPQKPERY